MRPTRLIPGQLLLHLAKKQRLYCTKDELKPPGFETFGVDKMPAKGTSANKFYHFTPSIKVEVDEDAKSAFLN